MFFYSAAAKAALNLKLQEEKEKEKEKEKEEILSKNLKVKLEHGKSLFHILLIFLRLSIFVFLF